MPCLLAILGFFSPRLVIVLLAIFSGYLGRAFATLPPQPMSGWMWPLLGFFFMPLTTLAVAFSINYGGGVSGGYIVLVLIAAMFDLGFLGDGSRRARRYRDQRRNVRVVVNRSGGG